jgi:hypothetical protein
MTCQKIFLKLFFNKSCFHASFLDGINPIYFTNIQFMIILNSEKGEKGEGGHKEKI